MTLTASLLLDLVLLGLLVVFFLVGYQRDVGFQLFQQSGAPLRGGGGALVEEGAPVPGGTRGQQHAVRLGVKEFR